MSGAVIHVGARERVLRCVWNAVGLREGTADVRAAGLQSAGLRGENSD